MKKLLLLLSVSSFLTSNALAQDLEVKFNGILDFSAHTISGADTQKKPISQYNGDLAFVSGAAFNVLAMSTTDNDVKYGAKITLLTTTRSKGSATYNGSHIFVEKDNFGRLEVGSPFDAMSNMAILGTDASKGPKGSSLGYSYTNPNGTYGVDFLKSPDFLLGDNLRSSNFTDGSSVEPSRRVTYYTPKFADIVQFGISYTPDSANNGLAKYNNLDTVQKRKIELANGTQYGVILAATNVVSLAANVQHQLSQDFGVQFGVAGSFGKSVQQKAVTAENAKGLEEIKIEDLTGDAKMANLKEMNIGAILTYKNFGFSVSYTNLGDSFTSVEADGATRNTQYTTASVSYTKGPAGVGAGYFNSNQRDNIFQGYFLNSEYKIAQGFKVYGELSHYNAIANKALAKAPDNDKGFVFLVGSSVSF